LQVDHQRRAGRQYLLSFLRFFDWIVSANPLNRNSTMTSGVAINPASEPVAYRGRFDIGGVSVQVSSERMSDVTFGPSLDPFRVEGHGSDIDISVEWIAELSEAPERKLFDSGSVWRLYECGSGFRFDFSTPSLGASPYKRFVVDRHFRSAALQMSERSFAGRLEAADPMDYPLDELLIMHRLTQEKAIELHSCGIVRPDGTGNLFVGHSGAGKSTTTRLWTEREDVEVLSDDRIIVRRDDQVEKQTPPLRSAQSRNDKGKMRMYGTPWHGEAAYASPGSAPLARIFILQHGHGNVLTQLSPSQAVTELFARSFVPFHRHEYVESALDFLQELVDAVPCYRYAFEPNEAAVERILEFRD
jgi:hypothetical protein